MVIAQVNARRTMSVIPGADLWLECIAKHQLRKVQQKLDLPSKDSGSYSACIHACRRPELDYW